MWDVVNKQLDTFPANDRYPSRGEPQSDLTLLTAQACTMFVLDTYARARNNKKLRDWISVLIISHIPSPLFPTHSNERYDMISIS
jgi:hypothetical protein